MGIDIDFNEYVEELKGWGIKEATAISFADSLSRDPKNYGFKNGDLVIQVAEWLGAEKTGHNHHLPLLTIMLKMQRKIIELEARVQRVEQPLFEFIHENEG